MEKGAEPGMHHDRPSERRGRSGGHREDASQPESDNAPGGRGRERAAGEDQVVHLWQHRRVRFGLDDEEGPQWDLPAQLEGAVVHAARLDDILLQGAG
eukprot:scaffold91_cov254-Pinguiococcus_pyrenoidosus.AAC.26